MLTTTAACCLSGKVFWWFNPCVAGAPYGGAINTSGLEPGVFWLLSDRGPVGFLVVVN